MSSPAQKLKKLIQLITAEGYIIKTNREGMPIKLIKVPIIKTIIESLARAFKDQSMQNMDSLRAWLLKDLGGIPNVGQLNSALQRMKKDHLIRPTEPYVKYGHYQVDPDGPWGANKPEAWWAAWRPGA